MEEGRVLGFKCFKWVGSPRGMERTTPNWGGRFDSRTPLPLITPSKDRTLTFHGQDWFLSLEEPRIIRGKLGAS